MPPVASEATTPAFKPSLPNPVRAAQSFDRAPSTPFESLLDDSAQGASDQTPSSPPPPADKPPQSAQADSTTPPAEVKVRDGDAVKTTKADATSKTAPKTAPETASTTVTTAADAAGSIAPEATATDGDAVSNGKAKADAKIWQQTAAGDDSKQATDGKKSDAKPADPAAIATGNLIQTAIPAAPVAAAITPVTVTPAVAATVPQDAPATVTQTVQAAVLQAAAATGSSKAVTAGANKTIAADASKAKSIDRAAAKTDASQLADDANSSVKTASAPQGDAKPTSATGDADKQAAPRPHDEAPAIGHHAATAEASPAALPDAQAAAPKAGADAAQQTGLIAPSTDGSQSATAAPAAPPTSAAQALAVPLAGVAIEIAGKAFAGKNRFEIRLDPPELGRIEVHLDVDRDGQTTTRLIADRSDTLDLLRRDSTGLERALQDAGLKTSDNGLQFSLRDQTMGRDQSNTPTPSAAQIVVKDDALPVADISPRSYSRLAGMGSGIDIRV